MQLPTGLRCTLNDLRCTLLSYAEPYIAMLLSTELRYTQLKYAAFF
jgi:hypothetical protein